LNFVGAWTIDEADERARAELGDVLLEFDETGRLTYVIRGKESDQVIKLRYQVDGDTIVTDQPSAPQTERTSFSCDGRTLTLSFGGVPYRFQRCEAES
jgi:hypothetical protein